MAHTRYLDIADELAATLTAASTGSRAPSEHEVMSRFQVGRSAARSAIGELEQRGLVRRIQGAGTFVHHPPTLIVEAGEPTVWQQMMQLGIGTTEVLSMRSGALPNLVANAIGVPTGSPGIWMTMRLTAFDQVVGRSAIWASGADRPAMAKAMREHHSLPRELDFLQVRLHYRWARVTLGPADHELATDLEMPVDRHHWRVEGVVEDKPHKIAAWVRTEFRADRINLSLRVGSAPARSDTFQSVDAAAMHGGPPSPRQVSGMTALSGAAARFGAANAATTLPTIDARRAAGDR